MIINSTRRAANQIVQPSRSTALGRVPLTRTLQRRARQDVGVVNDHPCAGWRPGPTRGGTMMAPGPMVFRGPINPNDIEKLKAHRSRM